MCGCKRRLAACHRLGRQLETRFRQRELEAEDTEAAAAEEGAAEAARKEDKAEAATRTSPSSSLSSGPGPNMGPVEGQLPNLLGRHVVLPGSDLDIQFNSPVLGAPATKDTPLIPFGTVDLGAVRSERMGPDLARALGRDEADDQAGG